MHLIYSILISLILLNHHIIVSDVKNFKLAFAMLNATHSFKDSHLFAMPQI